MNIRTRIEALELAAADRGASSPPPLLLLEWLKTFGLGGDVDERARLNSHLLEFERNATVDSRDGPGPFRPAWLAELERPIGPAESTR